MKTSSIFPFNPSKRSKKQEDEGMSTSSHSFSHEWCGNDGVIINGSIPFGPKRVFDIYICFTGPKPSNNFSSLYVLPIFFFNAPCLQFDAIRLSFSSSTTEDWNLVFHPDMFYCLFIYPVKLVKLRALPCTLSKVEKKSGSVLLMAVRALSCVIQQYSNENASERMNHSGPTRIRRSGEFGFRSGPRPWNFPAR